MNMTTSYVIETQGLGKTYKEVHALQSLDLKVQQNTICGFLGTNGGSIQTWVFTTRLVQAEITSLLFLERIWSRYLLAI